MLLLIATLSSAERAGLDRDLDAERRARELPAHAHADGERPLVEWATTHRDAAAARSALHHVAATVAWTTAALLIVALIVGAVAAQAALAGGTGDSINIVRLIVGLLGVQSIVLLAWLTFMVVQPRSLPFASIGGVALAILRSRIMLGRNHQPIARAALAISWNDMTSRLSLRGRFGAISNATWAMFNLGCVAMLLVLLSTQEHRFHWETTILSARSYASITSVLGLLPATLGFPVPTSEQVASTEGLRVDRAALDAARTAWAGLLVGALVAFALLPRLALTLMCLAPILRRTSARERLLGDPTVTALRERLRPTPQRLIVDAETGDVALAMPTPRRGQRDSTHTGPPAIAAIEPPQRWTPWPPVIARVAWLDLGVIDDRHGRDEALRRLQVAAPVPRCLVIACSLLNTPDRGEGALVVALVTALGDTSQIRSIVLLSDGQALRERFPGDPGAVEARVELWRDMLGGIGVAQEDVLELDLRYITPRSEAALAALIAPHESTRPESGESRLDEAFALIGSHARDRQASAKPEARATLMRSIAGLYRSESALLARWLGVSMPLGAANLQEELRRAASRVTSVLPTRLGLDPRWLAAGAIAGAVGCVAVATVATPVALGMLPIWSAVGAAVSAAIRATTGKDGVKAHAVDAAAEASETLRAAALFAVVLELQGRDESAITRILDRAFDDRAPSPEHIQAWLAGVRQRIHLAIALERGA